MKSIRCVLYDGKTSAGKDVSITLLDTGALQITGDGVDATYALSEVRMSPRLGNARRLIALPDGSQCETEDNETIDRFLEGQRKQPFNRLLYLLETRLRYIVLAVLLAAGVAAGVVGVGIPVLAKRVAFSLPASAQASLGRDTLELLDRKFVSPSRLPIARRRQIEALFDDLKSDLPDGRNLHLELRSGGRIGANALALPSGVVILTDELVGLAKHDEELVAVLAHELGHLQHQHALRQMLESSAVTLITVLTGAQMGNSAGLGALPAALVEAKYSREFESEADAFALRLLKARGISARHFANILSRLEDERNRTGRVPTFLSSHPATEERVNAMLKNP